jgi:hypothetical protein
MGFEVVFPLIVSSPDPSSTYLVENAQAWIDDIGAEPMPPER